VPRVTPSTLCSSNIRRPIYIPFSPRDVIGDRGLRNRKENTVEVIQNHLPHIVRTTCGSDVPAALECVDAASVDSLIAAASVGAFLVAGEHGRYWMRQASLVRNETPRRSSLDTITEASNLPKIESCAEPPWSGYMRIF